MSEIDVRCEAAGDGRRCRVVVSDERGASTYDVGVPAAGPFLASLLPDPGFDDTERLVHETFAFLLEREATVIDPGPLRPPGRRALLPRVPGRDAAPPVALSARPALALSRRSRAGSGR